VLLQEQWFIDTEKERMRKSSSDKYSLTGKLALHYSYKSTCFTSTKVQILTGKAVR
jgi:hypothetical protein